MTIRDVLLILCSVGGIQSIFLGIDFFFFFEKRSLSSKLLGGLFFALGLRVIKSTFYIFTSAVPLWFINVGFAAHYFIGPLLLLFVITLTRNRGWKWQDTIHFIPGFAIVFIGSLAFY